MNKYAIVLAAGKGTRMKSDKPKVVHPICGVPMVQHIINTLEDSGITDIYVVVGHKSDVVKNSITSKVTFIEQFEQKGTAHAVIQASPFLADKEGTVLILSGDTPLVTTETITDLLNEHKSSNSDATVITANLENPYGYGRIFKEKTNDNKEHFIKIIEEKDASPLEKQITEVNAGIYAFDNVSLFKHLNDIDSNNNQSEYYLTDLVHVFHKNGKVFSTKTIENFDEALGINDKVQLAAVTKLFQRKINIFHMLNGVTIIDPEHTYIESKVSIGEDTIIYPGTVLRGDTSIGKCCVVHSNVELMNCLMEDYSDISGSYLVDANIKRSYI